MQRFEGDRYVAHIDHDDRPDRDVYVVAISGKLPGGSTFPRFQDYRESYAEARALVRAVTDL